MFVPHTSNPDRCNGVEFRNCAEHKTAASAARAGYRIGGHHPGVYSVRNTDTGEIIRYRVTHSGARKCKDQYPG